MTGSWIGIDELQRVAREVIGDPGLVIEGSMDAASVPGWDSLNHTLIVLELARQHDIELEPSATGDCADFDELIELLNTKRVDH